jgi:hypothetical protein
MGGLTSTILTARLAGVPGPFDGTWATCAGSRSATPRRDRPRGGIQDPLIASIASVTRTRKDPCARQRRRSICQR